MSQTSTVFDQLDKTKQLVIKKLSAFEPVDEGHRYPWTNMVWKSRDFRRAHFDVVDVRETKKLYMMHLTVFPHTTDGAPVFGFDLIAGPNKVTGAFHDFSPIDRDHELLNWFERRVSQLSWSKQRALPDWAREIFSGSMVAAGNITDEIELQTILELVNETLTHYLMQVGGRYGDFAQLQNKYCANQKRNPHTPRVMQSLGFDEEIVNEFIQKCLFPELVCV